MNMAAQNLTPNVSEQLEFIEKQRVTLRRALTIAQSIEQLHNGLEAAMLMGKPSGRLSKRVLKNYEQLTEKTRNLPTAQINTVLIQLDAVVKQKFQSIMDLARSKDMAMAGELLSQENASLPIDDVVNRALSDFRKKAQTAVALRILLKERGISSKPLVSPYQEEDLLKEIQVLEQKEKQCRSRVKNEIKQIQNGVAALLDNEDMPENTRLAVLKVQNELQTDLAHIIAGKQFAELPSMVEVIELSAEPPKENPTPEPIPSEPQAQNVNSKQRQTKKPRGFFANLWALLFGKG